MSGLTTYAIGAVVGLIGIAGLWFGAHAHEPAMQNVGLAVMGVAVLGEFWLIKLWFDQLERKR